MLREIEIEKPLPFEASKNVKVTAQQHEIEEIILRQRMYIKRAGVWYQYEYQILGKINIKEKEENDTNKF